MVFLLLGGPSRSGSDYLRLCIIYYFILLELSWLFFNVILLFVLQVDFWKFLFINRLSEIYWCNYLIWLIIRWFMCFFNTWLQCCQRSLHYFQNKFYWVLNLMKSHYLSILVNIIHVPFKARVSHNQFEKTLNLSSIS